ncbi:MAG TPA: hypothetical protein VHV26_08920 [Rhizomicrobium sp.]|nr:hypothetical protein [Rhizomicrobium sp.]
MSGGEKKMWFAPKTYGYGASLPIRWQGWALLACFVVAVTAWSIIARLYLTGGERTPTQVGGIILLLIPFVLIVRARTEGGWRWRNGDDQA